VRILFDQGTPAPLRKLLSSHRVETTFERGWSTLSNGDLLAVAEGEGFEIFVTTDKNLHNQQNLGGLRIAIVVLLSTSWPRIQKAASSVTQAIDAALPGSYRELFIP
jgi:predicted nuclease of predicted toxin-antitoxin system